jgi:hypothetical protein
MRQGYETILELETIRGPYKLNCRETNNRSQRRIGQRELESIIGQGQGQ